MRLYVGRAWRVMPGMDAVRVAADQVVRIGYESRLVIGVFEWL